MLKQKGFHDNCEMWRKRDSNGIIACIGMFMMASCGMTFSILMAFHITSSMFIGI